MYSVANLVNILKFYLFIFFSSSFSSFFSADMVAAICMPAILFPTPPYQIHCLMSRQYLMLRSG